MKLENWKPERLKIEKNEKGTFTLSGTLPTGERLRTRFPTKAAAELSKSKILVDLGNTTIERITKLNVEQEEEYLAALKILKISLTSLKVLPSLRQLLMLRLVTVQILITLSQSKMRVRNTSPL